MFIDNTETSPLLNEHPERQLSSNSEKRRKKFILVTFAIIYVTVSASYSVIAPFYPTEVSLKTRIYNSPINETTH